MRFTLIILLVSLCSYSFTEERKSDEHKRHFVQFIVLEVENRSQAIEIDATMREVEGVEVSRMDHISSKYYAIIEGGNGYNEEFFITKFNQLGYQIKCFHHGIHGKDKIINQSLDCE